MAGMNGMYVAYMLPKPPVSQYDRGYEVGWKKGQQHNPTGGPNDCK